MDFSLTAEQELVRDTAREFCEREVAPHARDWDRSEEMDPAIVAKLGEIGFLAGWELDTVSYCLVMEELGVADSSVRGIVSVNVGLVGKTIKRWATTSSATSGSRSSARATRSGATRSRSPAPAPIRHPSRRAPSATEATG